ncbi:PIN domain-containing protein [Arthrobacter sp. 2RAF22]|uniref:PIN domain-containing protein n=1 Tax=Arthrobacter sp. 2RAF22 TaxID=3232996 RepID=UPI003F93225D
MWASAHIVMDTNVVLDLYKYHAKTTDLYLRSLRKYGPRLWLPYQVALEFHRNRPTVRAETTKGHKDRIKDLKSFKNKIQSNTLKSKLESSPVETELVEKTDEAIAALETELTQLSAETHVNSRDKLLDLITELFDGRVGDPPSPEQLEALTATAKQRFDDLIPPGYEDRGRKPAGEEYGDYLLWQQVLDYAQSHSKDIIIATEDNKADWWLKINGDDIVGPRPELIQEFRAVTGQEIVFYSGRDFFKELTDRAKVTRSGDELAGALADVTSVSDERAAAALDRILKNDFRERQLIRDRVISNAERELNELRLRSEEIEPEAEASSHQREDFRLFKTKRDYMARQHRLALLTKLREIYLDGSEVSDVQDSQVRAALAAIEAELVFLEASERKLRNSERHQRLTDYRRETEGPDSP